MDLLASATWPLGAVVSLALDARAASAPSPVGARADASSVAGKPFASSREHVAMQIACLPRLLLAHLAYTYLLGDWRTTARVFAFGWVARIVARDVALCWFVGLVTDGLHLSRASPFRASMARHKFNSAYPHWLRRAGTSAVLRDAAWSTLTAALAGLLEAAVLHACATGRVRYADVDAAGGWWTHAPTLLLMLTWFYSQNIQFYAMHRAMHAWGTRSVPDIGAWLYRHVHSLHHQARTPTAFSGIAMHPVEGLLYLSYALFPLLFAAHPIACIYIKTNLIVAAMLGHDGFESPAQGSMPHYIHHAHVSVNYAEAHLPIDWMLGTFAGTPEEARASMERRLAVRRGEAEEGVGKQGQRAAGDKKSA